MFQSTPVRERKQISRERSVGSAVQSHSATPERESRRTSFSYLSLLPQGLFSTLKFSKAFIFIKILEIS